MKRKVLVVDDDRLNLTLLEIGLKHKDYDVVTAQNGEEALAVVKSEQVDAIVLDIQMPKMNGYDFMKELQVMPQGKIPVIMLTASETMQDVFFMEGVRGYLVKPVDLEKLDQKIMSSLA
jgi:CheY-like chemotaxis protein